MCCEQTLASAPTSAEAQLLLAWQLREQQELLALPKLRSPPHQRAGLGLYPRERDLSGLEGLQSVQRESEAGKPLESA